MQNDEEFPANIVPGTARHELLATMPTPNDPPWNVPVAIGMWIASVLAIAIFPMLLLIPYLATQDTQIRGNPDLQAVLQSDPTSVLLQVIAVLPAHAFTLLLAWLVVTKGLKYSFWQTLGWDWGGLRWWHYSLMLAGFFLIAAVTGYFFPEQENDLIRILRTSRAAAVAVAILATFTAPLVEEVVYRGILYSALQRSLGVIPGILAATALFAVVHVPQYYPSGSTMFLLTLLSLLLTVVRAQTGNLLPAIILHTIFNGLQSLYVLLEPYLPSAEAPVQEAFFNILK